MPSVGLAPDVISYNSAIAALGKSGQPDEAMQLMKEMPGRGLYADAITCSSALTALGNSGLWEEALVLLREVCVCVCVCILAFSSFSHKSKWHDLGRGESGRIGAVKTARDVERGSTEPCRTEPCRETEFW